MRRLYLQVYFTIVASLVLVVITAGLLWHFSTSFPPFGQQFEVAGEIIAELVRPAAGGTHPGAATPGRAHARGVPRGHRARGRARRRSGGETAHRTARAAAARRRV